MIVLCTDPTALLAQFQTSVNQLGTAVTQAQNIITQLNGIYNPNLATTVVNQVIGQINTTISGVQDSLSNGLTNVLNEIVSPQVSQVEKYLIICFAFSIASFIATIISIITIIWNFHGHSQNFC